MTHHRWTPSELSYIKEKYPTVQTKVIAKRLNVREGQVRAIVKKYNLKKQIQKSSTNHEQHPYLKISFWENNRFWNNGRYTEKTRNYLDNWVEEMRINERTMVKQ